MTHDATLPFQLPSRPPVTRIRQRDLADLVKGPPARTQPMAGYDAHYGDIVDYIVRITEEIWRGGAIGRIRETYEADCFVRGSSSVLRSAEAVIAATVSSLETYPDQVTEHVNIAWRGDEDAGFYTSHLGLSTATNLGASEFGPATGKRVSSYFVADCISRHNKIHTEWLMHDSGAVLHHLGLDPHAVAKNMTLVSPGDGSAPVEFDERPFTPGADQETNGTPDGWARHHFGEVWNARALDHVAFHYAADAAVHWPGCREASGPAAITTLIVSLLGSLTHATTRVEHVSWSEETDGVILAVRWILVGTTQAGGLLGPVPAGRPIALRGSSHFRFGNGHVVEEWTVFDELDALVQAYRA